MAASLRFQPSPLVNLRGGTTSWMESVCLSFDVKSSVVVCAVEFL